MVGAVLQATLARHCGYLSQGPGGGGSWEGESDGQGDQEDSHQILSSCIHLVHKENIIKTKEEIP